MVGQVYQSVLKSVPLFHDATIKSTPKGFPQDISPIQVAPACIARLKSLMAASCSFCKLRHREGRHRQYMAGASGIAPVGMMSSCRLSILPEEKTYLLRKDWEDRLDTREVQHIFSNHIKTLITQPTYSYVRIRMMILRCVKGIKQTWIQTRQYFSVQASTRTCQVG